MDCKGSINKLTNKQLPKMFSDSLLPSRVWSVSQKWGNIIIGTNGRHKMSDMFTLNLPL